MNNFKYEFAITFPNNDTTYQYNDSPHLTQDFLDYLIDIDIDISECIYTVTEVTD